MVEFKGYITGAAERHFWHRERKLGVRIMYVALLLFLPIMVVLAISFQNWLIMGGYGLMYVLIPLAALIPQSKKDKLRVTPHHIYTEDGYIVSIVAGREEYQPIRAAKVVLDYGEFYEVRFPMGKISDKFICQKNWRVRGSLKEFEALFKGKIQKVSVEQNSK